MNICQASNRPLYLFLSGFARGQALGCHVVARADRMQKSMQKHCRDMENDWSIVLNRRLPVSTFSPNPGAYTGGGGGGGGSPLPMNPPRSFKFRFKINGMRAHCVRARFRDRSRPWFMHRIRMRRSFNFQGSDRCIARKTVLLGEASY